MNDVKSIPKIIHQTWKTQAIPIIWLPLFGTWSLFCQTYGYVHRLWTDEDNRNLIATHYAWFLPYFDRFKYPIQRADAVRYFILHLHGGIYSDLDMCPKKEMFAKLHEMISTYGNAASAAIPITKNKVWKDTLTNSFMLSQPKSLFMEHIWMSLMNPSKFHWTPFKTPLRKSLYQFEILFTTGPGIVSDQAVLHPELLITIPLHLIGDPSSSRCIMMHAEGGSWHCPDKMKKDILRLVIIILILFVAVIMFIVTIFVCYQKTAHNKKKFGSFFLTPMDPRCYVSVLLDGRACFVALDNTTAPNDVQYQLIETWHMDSHQFELIRICYSQKKARVYCDVVKDGRLPFMMMMHGPDMYQVLHVEQKEEEKDGKQQTTQTKTLKLGLWQPMHLPNMVELDNFLNCASSSDVRRAYAHELMQPKSNDKLKKHMLDTVKDFYKPINSNITITVHSGSFEVVLSSVSTVTPTTSSTSSTVAVTPTSTQTKQ